MRLVIWDDNDGVRLGNIWEFGARGIYRHKFDYSMWGYTWDEVCEFLGRFDVGHFREIQYWGHGKIASAILGGEAMRAKHLRLMGVALKPDGLIWLRCCSVFAGKDGKKFATNAALVSGRAVASYTHKIGYFQSGLHAVRPGEIAWWKDTEGLGKDGKLIGSGKNCENTIKFKEQFLPDWAYDK